MRMLVCLLSLGFAACQHADSAERSAELTSKAAKASVAAPAPAPEPAVVPATMPADHHSCGCGGGGSCGGSCGGQCAGAAGETPTWAALPENTRWTALHVTGMHCGGCAKRIERALAKVDGVLGVKVDLQSAKVEVATVTGKDARQLTETTIDGLGYHVE